MEGHLKLPYSSFKHLSYIYLLQGLEKDAEEQEKLRKKERKKQLKTMYKV